MSSLRLVGDGRCHSGLSRLVVLISSFNILLVKPLNDGLFSLGNSFTTFSGGVRVTMDIRAFVHQLVNVVPFL